MVRLKIQLTGPMATQAVEFFLSEQSSVTLKHRRNGYRKQKRIFSSFTKTLYKVECVFTMTFA